MAILIAPSILSADFARLGEQVAEAGTGGADYIHIDVMDGHFVPNITLGPQVVAAIRPYSKLIFDAHLMIENPQLYIADFAKAGADIITVHVEAVTHLHRVVQAIQDMGKRAGVALNPATSLTAVEEILPYADLILIMSVNPGFGGQSYIPTMTAKIARLRRMLAAVEPRNLLGRPAELEVDGGIKVSNIAAVAAAGADVLVAGSAVYNKAQSVAEAIASLRRAVLTPPHRGRRGEGSWRNPRPPPAPPTGRGVGQNPSPTGRGVDKTPPPPGEAGRGSETANDR